MSIPRITQILETSPLAGAGTPTDFNVTMTLADTQYSQVIPDGTRSIAFAVIGGVSTDNFRTAFVTGKVATPTAPYSQLPCNVGESYSGLYLVGKTLYFACSAAGKIIQIRTFS